MRVHPMVDAGLGNSAYVVDLGDGGALVVDPARDPRRYVAQLKARGLTARFVVETHLHADFVSGGRELVSVGAELLAPAGAGLAYGHRPLDDDDEVDLGGLALRVIATPGHTPEHLAYLLLDGSIPLALFTGGTLMAGGVARPDLLSAEQTEPLARAAYRSIHERLLTLPDDLDVFPTHGGGSFCAATPGGERTTTIGRERLSNPLLAGDPDEDAFVARLLGGLGSYPPYFLELRDVNRAGPAVVGREVPAVPALSADAVERAVADGAVVVDVRGIEAFASGHVPGALSIPWRPQFSTWLGWLVQRDQPVVVVADDTVDRADLVWSMLTIGFDQLLGEVDGGMPGWNASGRPVATTQLVGPDGANGRQVVDVRQRAEFAMGHAAGAVNVELGALRAAAGVVGDGPVLAQCGHGERAMTAASLLQRAGHPDVAVLAGGPQDLGEMAVGG